MRQPRVGFKITCLYTRKVSRAMAGAIFIFGSTACSTLGLDRNSTAKADAAVVTDTLKRDNASLRAEVVGLKSENARLQREMADLARETKKVAQASKVPVLKSVANSDSVATKPAPPATIESRPSANVPVKTVVEAANAGSSLPNAPVPVDDAPRLVQPSFTSSEQPVFENEAEGGEIRLSSVLWGVHLASYRKADEAKVGWQKLQRENPDQLGLLEPRIERVDVPNKGEFLRLIGGGFSSEEKARVLCSDLQQKGLFCSVASFGGERLSSGDAS